MGYMREGVKASATKDFYYFSNIYKNHMEHMRKYVCIFFYCSCPLHRGWTIKKLIFLCLFPLRTRCVTSLIMPLYEFFIKILHLIYNLLQLCFFSSFIPLKTVPLRLIWYIIWGRGALLLVMPGVNIFICKYHESLYIKIL